MICTYQNRQNKRTATRPEACQVSTEPQISTPDGKVLRPIPLRLMPRLETSTTRVRRGRGRDDARGKGGRDSGVLDLTR